MVVGYQEKKNNEIHVKRTVLDSQGIKNHKTM